MRQSSINLLLRTSTPAAPWTVIEGNDKLRARIKTQRTLIEALEAAPRGRVTPWKQAVYQIGALCPPGTACYSQL